MTGYFQLGFFVGGAQDKLVVQAAQFLFLIGGQLERTLKRAFCFAGFAAIFGQLGGYGGLGKSGQS
jgi:hypothetical protein